jgi:MFS family permease
MVGFFVLLGIASLITSRGMLRSPADDWESRLPGRRYGFVYRRSWTPALAIMLLYLVHWGAVSAYLPQYAELASANVGLFFAADGLLSLLIRVPSGWLADRVEGRWLVLAGLAVTALALGMLALPVTSATLVGAGTLTGAGAALLTTPVYVELAGLSAGSERGTAFSMVMVAAGVANVLGSAGLAPVIDAAGFGAAILVSMTGLMAATAVALADPRLATIGHPSADARKEPAP